MRIAYYYQGNKEYIDKLKEYDLYVLIDNAKKAEELLDYNVNIRNIKYDNETYDILVSETDEIRKISAIKKVVIGRKENKKPRYYYIDSFNIEKILEKPQKKDYKFSIIVPNYNNAEWIGKTIESVLSQTYTNWEMYVIDDMSTDNSIDVIKSYKDDRITLIENKIKWYNGGSRNWGILRAKESNPEGYLLFIDSDDWYDNNKVLEDINNFLEDEDLITFNYKHCFETGTFEAERCTYKNKDDLFMTYGCMCAVWCKCFKVSIAPLFEFNTLMEDRNYHYRLINRIDSFAHLDKYMYVWNKMNKKSITTEQEQIYDSELQPKLQWEHCAYRHIAGMLDTLNEIKNPKWREFLQDRISKCIRYTRNNEFYQY